ncbi:MAG: hypothetical protein IJL56_09545 [Bacteroidales bacterium]|nr:hypothetical protein [Bacteroidales bacterium]
MASDEYSWTKVRTYRTSNIFADDVTYYNGLGYPVEVRSVDHTAGYDLGTALTYDALMREPRKWLPVPYEDLGYTESEWAEAFLPAEDGILSYYQEQYGTEPDPDDDPVPVRPFSETHSEFSPSGRPLSTSLPGEQYYLHPTSYNYLAATIDGRNVVGVKTTDGDGRVSVEWKDYEGRLVAEDRQISGSPARTLYRYDWRGNLTEVITPEGNTYSYSYDSRSRVISKTIPGKEAETFTYDALDRIITSQDGNQREGGVTILYQYDNVGNLTFKKARQGNVSRTMEEHTYNANTGLKTSEKFYKLTADGWVSGTDYLSRTYTYDNEERVISVAETDYPQSYSLTTGYAYDLQGNVTSTTETCVKSNVTLAVTTERGYDSRSRPTLETVKIGNSTKSTVSYTYDDLGRLYGKYYGTGTNRITESSGYDIHGWLTSRGGNLLTQGYGYENTSSPSWVGNITKWDWHHVATVAEGTSYATKSESFTYDALNRLTGSAMTSGGQSAGNAWSERNISYDLDGNLLHLDRYQDVSATPNTTLSFTYSGNHRTGYGYDDNGNITYDPLRNFEIKYNLLNLISEVSVPGARNNPDTELSNTVFYADGTRAGVKDPATGNWTSRYIGSLIYKGVNGQESLEGIQTADGFIDCSSGVSNAQMQYFLRDHLGSVRVIASDKNTVVSRTDYLPFGVRMTGNGLTESTTARSAWFGFSGKENELWNAQSSTSHWVRGERYQHFGARYYDPVACSWTGVDPLAEKYPGITPYAYCAGDPVNYVDPDGKDIAILKKKRGQHIALLIQQKNESNNLVWKYYSVNGDNIYNLRGEHTGGRLFDDLGEHEFDTVQDFLDSDFNQEGSKYDTSIAGYIYDKAYVIETDINHIQDDLAAEEFRKASDENYRLAFPVNHCATAVQRSLDAAGINNAIELRIPTNPSISIQSVYYHPYLPSLAYKAIKSLNPDGKELFRSH